MNKLIVTMLAVVTVAAGQEAQTKPAEAGPRAQKIFQIKYANVDNLWAIFNNLAKVSGDKTLRVISVEGTPEAVAAIEDAVKRLDVPQPPTKNIELTFQMIMARPAKDGALPAELALVQKNLESLFGFKGFQLMETALLRGRDGFRVEASGTAPNPGITPSDSKMDYRLQAVPGITATSTGNVIRIDQLALSFGVPNSAVGSIGSRRAEISTQIDVREGQKVVVGKANVDGSDGALVLVVTAKVVE